MNVHCSYRMLYFYCSFLHSRPGYQQPSAVHPRSLRPPSPTRINWSKANCSSGMVWMQVHSSRSAATRAPGTAYKKCGGTSLIFYDTHFSVNFWLHLVSPATVRAYRKTSFTFYIFSDYKTDPKVRSVFSVVSFRTHSKWLLPQRWPFWFTKKC